jgi:hypothetical protein
VIDPLATPQEAVVPASCSGPEPSSVESNESSESSAESETLVEPTVQDSAARGDTAVASARRGPAMRRIGAVLRTHWFFALVLALGATGRVLTMVAYQPALLYTDSFRYLANTGPLNPTGVDPMGYSLVLRLLLDAGNLMLVVAVQHLLGLAMGLCVYLLLLRHRMPRTLAVLASAPVLLDAYEWQIEQNILSDSLFLALITAGLVLLTWRRRSSPWLVASAGLLLGLAVTVRFVGEAALVPALLFVVLAAGPSWRRRMKVTAAFAVTCAIPLVSYAVYTHSFTGAYSLQASNNGMLYGRTATIADCASLPADLEPLCPSGSAAYRDSLGPDFYTSTSGSPFFTSGDARQANPFSDYVIKHQPLAFAEAVGHDFLQLFLSPHDDVNDGTAVSRWQFQTTYPQFPPPLSVTTELATYGHSAPSVNVGVAQVLRDYQLGGGYTPDAAYAVFLLAGLGGALGLTRGARRSGLRLRCALWTGTGVILLLGADVFLFSWRYQLPALITLPIGGAYGIAALLGLGKISPPTTRPR